MGTPVQWSTQHSIEAPQRILKAAWRRTSRVAPAEQILRRIAVLRYIYGVLLPSFGVDSEPVAALLADRQTQAFLSGSVDPVPGITSPFPAPADPAQTLANTRLRTALRDARVVYPDPEDDGDDPELLELPQAHIYDGLRAYTRRFGFFSREGICAVSVPAFPHGARDDDDAMHAIFSMYEPDPVAAAPGGVIAAAGHAAAAPVVESSTTFFLVEGRVSYDVTGLSAATPNVPPVGPRLTPAEQNSSRAVDLAIGRRAIVQPTVSAPALGRSAAERVFKRVKLAAKREFVDVGDLCQPCYSFPYLGSVDTAKRFFKSEGSKWDAEQWLVCPKLY